MLNCRNCCKRRLTKISDLNGKKNWSTLITTTSGASDLFQWFTSSSKPLNVLFLANSTIFTVARLQSGYALRECARKLRINLYYTLFRQKFVTPRRKFLPLQYCSKRHTKFRQWSSPVLLFTSFITTFSTTFLLGLFSSQIYTTSWPHSTQYIRTVILLEMLDHIIDRPNHHSHHQI